MARIVALVALTLVVLTLVAAETPALTPADAANERLLGDDALNNKKYDTAIEHYTKAIEIDPDHYLSYYKRASIYLIRGRNDRALRDLTRVLELNPSHTQSLIRRGKLYLSFGDFDEAERDMRAALKDAPTNSIIHETINKVESGRKLLESARSLAASKNIVAAKNAWSRVLDFATASEEFLIERARCSIALGDSDSVLEDTMKILKTNGRNLDAILLRGQVLAASGDTETAIKFYRQGLKHDPDHTAIKKEYTILKKFNKALEKADQAYRSQQWQEALNAYGDASEALPTYKDTHIFFERRCHALLELRRAKEAIEQCDKAIQINDNLYEAHYFKGEAYMRLDDADSAYREFSRARQVNQHDRRAQDGLQRAEQLRKVQKRKDYYKILGVDREATIQLIRKAYRKRALEWHPDKHPEEKKAEAEQKFQEINEAYEILTDEEKRGRYDRGEDLNENPGMPGGGFQQNSPFHFTFRYG